MVSPEGHLFLFRSVRAQTRLYPAIAQAFFFSLLEFKLAYFAYSSFGFAFWLRVRRNPFSVCSFSASSGGSAFFL
jgi:hypothetical protein